MDQTAFLQACQDVAIAPEVLAHIQRHLPEIAARYDELTAPPPEE